jgi:hypothetical protein
MHIYLISFNTSDFVHTFHAIPPSLARGYKHGDEDGFVEETEIVKTIEVQLHGAKSTS